ncbi:hypothetical protein P3T25_005132 [Paraburkholderia sp. GAS32]
MRTEGKVELSKATAEELARECQELRDEITRLCWIVPPHVLSGSVQAVWEWKTMARRALKIATDNGSSFRNLRAMRFVMVEMADPAKFVYDIVGQK